MQHLQKVPTLLLKMGKTPRHRVKVTALGAKICIFSLFEQTRYFQEIHYKSEI